MFFRLILSTLVLATAHVGWRAGSVPWIRRALPWPLRTALLAALASSYLAARYADRAGWSSVAWVLEVVGAHWLGILLILLVPLLAADVATGFGLFFRRHLASIRAWAFAAGGVLVALAFVQGNRPPVVREHEVRLAGLRAEDDGIVLVFVSDTHAGALVGERWLRARVAQVSALGADAILLGGDLFEGDSEAEARLVPLVGGLSAPLGVWAVPGNHDRHDGGRRLRELEALGVRVLRDERAELRPGLILAGLDNSWRGDGLDGRLARALAGRPADAATVLLSHAPSRPEEAARAGVGLMLAGHTHDGQIWPFRYVVRTEFRYLAGRYDVAGMPLIVCRGTGTFGPRMRLWHPSEILRVTLRAAR